MSRIGKVPVTIPKDVKYSLENRTVNFEGPKGKLSLNIPYGINVEQKDEQLIVARISSTKQDSSNYGTIRALIMNMVTGVTAGHKKELEIQGIGFRAQLQGTKLILNLGFSHPVEYEVPKDVTVTVPKPTSIIIESANKVLVGQVAAKIRGFKKPEPYKGKGIRYLGENVRRKQGKSVVK